jgi:NDP-mannose synthase
MSVLTLIMAGGRGERIRRSIGPIPKPLLTVQGIPLLELNLMALLRQGLRDIVVSVPASIPDIKRFVHSRGRPLIEAAGGTLDILEEEQPRGNIGCAAELRGRAESILVVLADNLTTLDLGHFLSAHRSSGACLTLATHLETLRSAYGEIEANLGRVTAYREKPSRAVLICSGIYALGDRALELIPENEPVGISTLVQRLLDRGEFVSQYHHSAPWVDVNDAEALRRAEVLVAEYREQFDCEGLCPPAY